MSLQASFKLSRLSILLHLAPEDTWGQIHLTQHLQTLGSLVAIFRVVANLSNQVILSQFLVPRKLFIPTMDGVSIKTSHSIIFREIKLSKFQTWWVIRILVKAIRLFEVQELKMEFLRLQILIDLELCNTWVRIVVWCDARSNDHIVEVKLGARVSQVPNTAT